ncbi:12280_t:CDS:2, partial [Racocetra fulgida]
ASSLENESYDLLLEIDYQIVDSDDDSSTINLENKNETSLHNDEKSHEGILQLYVDRVFNAWEEGIGATLQYNLLKAKYLDKYIDKKDIYNAIQQFQVPSCENLETDAAKTLKRLLALKTEDSDWIVVPKIKGKKNRLTALFWILLLQ